MTSLQPLAFELHPDEGRLLIGWSDGSSTSHSMALLRRECPCATCRTERDKMQAKGPTLRVISSGAPAVSQAEILSVTPVGRYALSFKWNDGHQTGIYSYDFLLAHSVAPP